MKTVQLTISGRVQGVYFRMYTQKQALKLNIKGFVRNLSNGSVEVVAYAEQEQWLDKFIQWCHKGPILAKVSRVEISKYTGNEQFSEFKIR